ncbi:unnamed protein product [Spirodela intermedia]|uniref:Uncharacterized protein n=1 Tax=Spirodela intermedia TaxID=51605 RepID=A0A7I8KTN6_SPIIN|nr:unnamed protein product [Spirodela intermedia]CAA7400364.1 unnamed protein product [Spirodela intermedia]CAA7400365.1 unnamed protein product [Spirodela intermedia]
MATSMAMLTVNPCAAGAAAGRRLQGCRRGSLPPATFRRGAVKAEAGSGRTRFHKAIEKDGIVLMPGCFDALSAAIIQKTGFSAAFISGYALSAASLGLPDIGLLTPPEMAESARFICAAAPGIPIIADADTGGGNALNVQRTVKDLIAAGVAGCFLEDQAWPKKCGHMRGKSVIPAEEHAAKIAAARDAIGDADFFLIARTDARGPNGLDDAIDRANLNEEELREIGRRTKGLRVSNMIEGGITPLRTPQELQAMGFHIVEHCLTTLYAATRGMTEVLRILKEAGTTREALHKLATFEEFNQMIDLDSWNEIEARFSKYKVSEKVLA